MRRRLRPAPSAEEMGQLYARPHQHERWADHRMRVDVTAVLAAHLLPGPGTIVDLSCGDAAIARRLAAVREGSALVLGDFALGYDLHGPIEETALQVPEGAADIWILSETLEHLDDPEAVLRLIRPRTHCLLLSTPDGEVNDSNPEHLWAWDSEEVGRMLAEAGFQPIALTRFDLRLSGFLYCYQIWSCQ